MIRRAALMGCLAAVVATIGCSGPESDAGGESAQAQTATVGSDVLGLCPSLEEIALSSYVVSDAATMVRQTYKSDGAMHTFAQNPSTLYSIRFYRDASGHSKFKLEIGTF